MDLLRSKYHFRQTTHTRLARDHIVDHLYNRSIQESIIYFQRYEIWAHKATDIQTSIKYILGKGEGIGEREWITTKLLDVRRSSYQITFICNSIKQLRYFYFIKLMIRVRLKREIYEHIANNSTI